MIATPSQGLSNRIQFTITLKINALPQVDNDNFLFYAEVLLESLFDF
jgi:hypothetical protein